MTSLSFVFCLLSNVTHGFALTWQFTSRVRAGLWVKWTKYLVTDNHDQEDWQSAVLPAESSRSLPKYRWHLNYDFDHNHDAQIRKIFSFSTSQRSDCNHVKVLSCYQKIQARFAYMLWWLHSETIGIAWWGNSRREIIWHSRHSPLSWLSMRRVIHGGFDRAHLCTVQSVVLRCPCPAYRLWSSAGTGRHRSPHLSHTPAPQWQRWRNGRWHTLTCVDH